MSAVAPVLLLGFGGLLVGGALSMRKQQGSGVAAVILLVFALLAVAAGILWMVGD